MKLFISSIILVSIATLFTACSQANIQAQIRDSSKNTNMMTRCEEVDARNNAELEEVMSKYDGWRLIYISEYTSSHKTGTSASVCFERAKQ
jgi:hypothetical protein